MPISGSFVRGDWSGRVQSFLGNYNATNVYGNAASNVGGIPAGYLMISQSVPFSMSRERGCEPAVAGATQGIAFAGAPTTITGNGSFGRHMQSGINRDNYTGSPAAPSLRLDYPGNFWRFRWVVRAGNKEISILANQNSTGSQYRPSMVVRANPNVGIMNDMSASAADLPGWVKIGPITFTVTSGSDAVWVELHNNNYGTPNIDGILQVNPAYFDHIFVK